MQEELNVKVGDEVLYRLWNFGGTIERIETVMKVTPTGRIRIKGSSSQFNKYGREMIGDSWHNAAELSIPKEEDYKRIKENTVISKAISLIEKLKKRGKDLPPIKRRFTLQNLWLLQSIPQMKCFSIPKG